MTSRIQELFLQFEPLEPLEVDDPRYVECFEERGIPAIYATLTLPLASAQATTHFFSGHIGDGKTTILNHLRARFEGDGYCVAYGEADELLDLDDVAHEEILLAILTVVDKELRERFARGTETGRFRQLFEEISRIAQLPVELEAQANVPVGPFGAITATVKDAPDVRLQVRQDLRQARGPTFADVVNEYLDRAQSLVRSRGQDRLIVVLDNLDRLPETFEQGVAQSDERLFLAQASRLLALRCHVLCTVRLAFAHTHVSRLQERYGRAPVIVPMIPVRRQDGSPDSTGLAVLRTVLERRVQAAGMTFDEAFEDPAAGELCRVSGGHFRELMTLVQSSCAMAMSDQKSLPITLVNARAAIRDLRAMRRSAAADYRQILEQIARTHSLDGVPPESRQPVLSGRMVYEYWDDDGFWYDVCPLCEGA